MQVTVSNGDAYNVATEIDSEVYNQIASWYNEDQDTAGNGTLPLAPSGPGSQPSKQNAFVRWFKDNWGKGWFIAVVIVVCVGVAGDLHTPGIAAAPWHSEMMSSVAQQEMAQCNGNPTCHSFLLRVGFGERVRNMLFLCQY